MSIINYKRHIFHLKSKKFTSQYYYNLGEDVDKIINGYLKDLDEMCECESCKSFSFVFKNYYRLKNKIVL